MPGTSHSCEGNVKTTWDFLYSKGCISGHCALSLPELGADHSPTPGLSAPAQSPNKAPKSGDWRTPPPPSQPGGPVERLTPAPIKELGDTSVAEAPHSSGCPSGSTDTQCSQQQPWGLTGPSCPDRSSASCSAPGGELVFPVAPQLLPILFHWFLVVSTFGGEKRAE